MTQWNPTLLERLKGGDPGAFELLVDDYEGPLFRFFIFDHRNRHLAEDQSAETFAQLVRAIPMMTGNVGQLPAFVFTIARRVKQKDWRKRPLPTDPIGDAQHIPDARPSPDANMESNEQIAEVMAAIGALRQNAREAMLLHYVEGYSIDQVSNALGQPSGTIKSLLHRARIQVRDHLQTSKAQT